MSVDRESLLEMYRRMGRIRRFERAAIDLFRRGLGKCDVKRQGKDVTVVASGYMVWHAMQAAYTQADEGIDVEVMDPCTIEAVHRVME